MQAYHRNQNGEFQHVGDINSKIKTPIFQITGWWDRLVGTVDNFSGITENGPEQLRDKHRLVIGPWGHDATQYTGKIGPVDYGPYAATNYAELIRSEEHTSELQSRRNLVCRLLLEKKKKNNRKYR